MWLPEDRAKMLALRAWKRELCPKCGQRRHEWLDPETGVELRDPPFEVAEVFCPPCEAIHDWHEHVDGEQRRPGTHPYIRRVFDD